MSRYVPSFEEQGMADTLRVRGWAVVRQRTYDRLLERVRIAEHEVEWQKEWRESEGRWALDAFAEQRRLADRLDRVVAAAAAQGVTIQAINAALDGLEVVPPTSH